MKNLVATTAVLLYFRVIPWFHRVSVPARYVSRIKAKPPLPAHHSSPQSFRVKAEVVVAQPADARGELENGRFVRNRLVVVERGDIPIVHKVTHASRTYSKATGLQEPKRQTRI